VEPRRGSEIVEEFGGPPSNAAREQHSPMPMMPTRWIFVMGGEGINRVFGQNEAYDSAQDC
jgi:hypothetical protein